MSNILSAENVSKSVKKKNLLLTFENIFSLLKCLPTKNILDYHINIVQVLFDKIWPSLLIIIKSPFKRETDEDKVVEYAIRCIKMIMRTMPDKFLAYLQVVSKEIMESFTKNPLSSFVYFYELVLT